MAIWRMTGGTTDAPEMTSSFEGAVLQTYERNGYHDSDFYAIVYDAETDSIKHVEYATTRGWTYNNGATVDATDEVKALAAEVLRRSAVSQEVAAAEWAATQPTKGKAVRVVKGRKVPIGTEGTVFWYGEDKFGQSRWAKRMRVGIRTAEGEKHFTSADNVEVIDPEQYLLSVEDATAMIGPANPTPYSWRQAIRLPSGEVVAA